MLYMKENGVLIKLDSWEQVYSRPNFIKDLDLKEKKLKALIGYYKNEPPRKCGIKSCHSSHMKGGIVLTEDDFEASIGHMCGSKIFEEKFDDLIKQLEKEVDFEIYKEAVASRKARVFEYWNKAAALTSGKNGVLKLAEKIAALKDPLVAGRFPVMELGRMAANQQTKVTKEIWVEKKKKELTEEEAKSGEKKYKLETVVCGQIKNTEVLLSVNDLGKIYKEDIESVIQGLEKLDLQKATARQIQTIGRAASALDVRLETASRLKALATDFLTRENLYPMYEKMFSMDTISRKDLELYEELINQF
ncbi:hypothetical protein L1Q27_13965 [Klebsiella pneumoniae]|uniref:hypothetical protein n=1 Tax=Klebsiella TaxID=570 RepID=UPI001034854E|nr:MULTISPECIES: hypothetical protein [Klebsiella]MCD0204839.1 hypothetical protein [Klebsiella aerogenes]MCQ4010812.1 hypothetical protein [Klebsiella pneumoniae]HBX0979884.1 hypothetical protein [Klebsiella pneumoniae]HCC7935966.1 hypothetical protein [Klebsiella pneumoniae]HCM7226103.1 hypothetical protein [Klebsiella aerogenes]